MSHRADLKQPDKVRRSDSFPSLAAKDCFLYVCSFIGRGYQSKVHQSVAHLSVTKGGVIKVTTINISNAIDLFAVECIWHENGGWKIP